MFSFHPTIRIYSPDFRWKNCISHVANNRFLSFSSSSLIVSKTKRDSVLRASLKTTLCTFTIILFIFAQFSLGSCINIKINSGVHSGVVQRRGVRGRGRESDNSIFLFSTKNNNNNYNGGVVEEEVQTQLDNRDLQNPKIRASYVVNNTVKFNLRQVANQVNVTLVLPEEHYELSSGEDFIVRKVLRLDCTAAYPVEWIYEGAGAPFHLTSRSVRHVENFSDPLSYTFSTGLDIFKNSGRNAGRYSCQSTIQPARSSYYDVYTPNGPLFLSAENKTINLNENDTEIIIPCPVSDPRVPMNLYKIKSSKSHAEYLPVIAKVTFEPREGFHIPIAEHPDYQGIYFCRESVKLFSREKPRTSSFYTVLPPKSSYVRVTPDTHYVKITPGVKQAFKCESTENVTLTFSGDRQPRIINTENNISSQYLFTTMYELKPTDVSEHTIINCVTSNETILHTWEYSTYDDVSISKFYFDGKTRFQDARYICCSNSFYKPKLEYVFCRSETECQMKKLILREDNAEKEEIFSEYADRIFELNSTCVAYNPYLKYTLSGGILRCSVQGITNSYSKDYIYYFNPYRIFQAYTDTFFDTSKVKFSEAIMKLSKTPSKNILVGQKSRFLCYYSEYFFSNGIQWGLEMKNGSVKYISSSYSDRYNTSFSEVEMKFDDTEVKAVRCYAPVRVSPTEWRNLSGPMYVKETPTVRVLMKGSEGNVIEVLNDKPNSDTILDKSQLFSYYYRTVGPSLWKSFRSLFRNSRIFVVALECNATYPVEWAYHGDGSTDMDVQTYRIAPSIKNISTYTYSSVLTLFKLDEEAVGKYSCVSVLREFGHKGKDEDLNASFNIYVPGRKLFLAEGNQTLRLYNYRDSVLIPCAVSDPRVKIILHKFKENTWEILRPDLKFDASYGFSLNKTVYENLHGLYKCSDESQRFYSGVYNILSPKDTVMKPTPLMKEVKISKNESQTFKCESKENVTLSFSNDTILKGNLLYENNPDSMYPFSVSYKTQPLEFLNFTIINCTSVEDAKTLYTWEFYPDDSSLIDYFYFDNSTNIMTCCTKPYRQAQFDWIQCSSVSECVNRQSACLIKHKCPPEQLTTGITNADNGVDADYQYRQAGCIGFNITNKPEGFLRCSVKGILKIVAQAVVYYFNHEKKFELHDSFFNGPKIFDKFSTSNDKIMKMNQQSSTRNISLGDTVQFECTGSKFFLGAEMLWALERTNGSIEYVAGKDLTNRTRIHGQAAVRFDDSDWKNIYCIAPAWNDYYNWRNISLPLYFSGE